jgi:uncharacterized protein
VNDEARMIQPAARDRLEQKLRDLEGRTGAQVAVLTVESLEDESLETYSVRVAQTWKLGRKGVDDGVLFLVAKRERKMRIEVGYGLEARLTDLQSRRILDDVVRPRFKQGAFDEGVEAGVDAIIGTIEGKEMVPAGGPAAGRGPERPPLPAVLAGLGLFVPSASSRSSRFGGRAGWFPTCS